MDVLECILKRRSIRAYQDKRIQKDTLEKIVEAGRYATTARNVQPWEFVVVTEKDLLAKIGDVAEHGKFIANAPACIAVFCEDTKYYLEDGCAAVENMLIAATSFGVGTCWVAGDKKDYCDEVASLLHVPQGFKLVALISLGYPVHDSDFKVAHKRPLDEVLHWEKFQR